MRIQGDGEEDSAEDSGDGGAGSAEESEDDDVAYYREEVGEEPPEGKLTCHSLSLSLSFCDSLACMHARTSVIIGTMRACTFTALAAELSSAHGLTA